VVHSGASAVVVPDAAPVQRWRKQSRLGAETREVFPASLGRSIP